jgi:hypothetical protein
VIRVRLFDDSPAVGPHEIEARLRIGDERVVRPPDEAGDDRVAVAVGEVHEKTTGLGSIGRKGQAQKTALGRRG